MNISITPQLFIVTIALITAHPALAQSQVQPERVEASFILALGRAPTTSELATWSTTNEVTLTELLSRHREKLQGDPKIAQAASVKACVDAFGRAPKQDELAKWLAQPTTYIEQMQQHVDWLSTHPVEYEQVVGRAYERAVRRAVYPGEIKYWSAQPTLSYVLLVACIDNWARRNAPGLMETTGAPSIAPNCRFIAAVQLSPVVAVEARTLISPVGPDADAVAVAAGRTLIAAGAKPVISVGHMHLVTAGAADL